MAVMKAYQREYINKLVTPNRKEYALTLKNIGTIDQDTILEEAADHSRLDVDTLRHALNALTNTAVLYLKVGHGVQFGNFGSLQPSINVKAVTKKEDCTVKTMIGGVKINMQPTGAFAKAIAEMKVQLVNVSAAEKSEGSDDNSNVAPADPDPSNGNTGNQQGGLTPSEVTYTFKYHDDTEDSRSGQPGEAVDAPEPDSGYRWNTVVPTVFGNSNRTFTEVAVAQGGGTGTETYTATLHIGSSYVTRTGAAGSVLDLPELESGYSWPSNMPTVMPAQDFTAYAIEGEQDMTEYTLTVQHEGETIRTEQLHADDIVFLGTAPEGYKWTNTPRYSKMPARNWTVSTVEV